MPYRAKSILVILITFFISVKAIAQADYPVFKRHTEIKAEDSQKLTLQIYNLNYIYNTEYFLDIPLSGTLFGYQLLPEITYQPNDRLVIKAGVYLQKEFGREDYTSLLPTFSVKYKAKESSYILGTLEGNINHGFVEPIYDNKLIITERLENGFQFFVDTKPYNHDFYINWRRAIHLGDPFKEEFDIGYSARFNVLNKKNFELKIPIQLLYSHKGGQIDASNEALTSIVNGALGVSLKFKTGTGFLKNIITENYYVNYRDISGIKVQPFDVGNGYLSHLLMDFKYFNIDLRYWNSYSYINPRGNSLFSSVSEKHQGLTEKHRQLLLAGFIYDTEILRGGNFNFRVSPYYDFTAKQVEYSFEMYFSYHLELLLTRFKNSIKNE